MSLFDSASLVVTPNGVKEGKLYSIKPSDGSGDLSVTRATSATRVDANGLVEIPRTNLVLQSQTFENASWVKVNTTVTENTTTAPDGTTTADLVSLVSTSSRLIQSLSLGAGTYTISLYVKNESGNINCRLRAIVDGVETTFLNILATDSWQRFEVTFNANLSVTGFVFRAVSDIGNVAIWGAQLEQGVSATEYIPTVASIRTKFAGITQDGGSASNIPRLDYTNGSCPSILVEPQRTNLLLRSQEFGTSPWAFGGVLDTISANSIISPDGTQNADTFVCGYTGYSSIYQSATTTSGTLYTFSVFAKKGNQNKLSIELRGADTTPNIVFDLNNGTILSGSGGTITSVGNGWYKCTLTKLSNSTSTLIIIGRGLTGSIGDTFNLYGAQLEVGSYATSYIPTTSASVTRNADIISKTGISSLIGQTEGTLFLDYNLLNFLNQEVTINNVYTNSISLGFLTDTTFKFRCLFFSNSIATNLTSGTISALGNYKIAVKYKSGENKLFINGVLVASNTSTLNFTTSLNSLFLNTATAVYFGNNSKSLKSMAIWKTQLTDDECINLTTI
jgi:hypothetical protein